ncbi:aldo/keto reductase [Bacillus sp. FJAT-50079]|uniref:aldo/keto reductase n=1 Tax=Bacillus sp. FJAT-50079 TaxID=2833577 RepID=UPI001BC92C19|nr:aldo/keto reductase [Bacillus sp. FJAT-50079]MBS4208206.1 aldo/keto reductase [Bacillus sp. FJAT-50079]
MRQIELSKTGEKVSGMALGTMYFNTTTDAKTSMEIMDCYIDYGGNFIDTANMYVSWLDGFEGGESEELIGKWMSQRKNRNELFISTKVGLGMKDVPSGLQKDLILRECEKSLRRLKIDTIDLYFVHREDLHTPMEETLEALDILQRQGKIRHVGISNHRSYRVAEAKQISEQKGYPEFTFAQYRYTYLRPKLGTPFDGPDDTRMHATEDLLDYVHENNMTFMCYQTLLSGAYSRMDKQIPTEYIGPDSDERMKVLRAVTEETGASINQVVLAWAMQNKMRALPLISANSRAHIIENMNACDVNLSKEQIKRLDEAGI